MRVELSEVLWLDQHHELSLREVAELSGFTEAELTELVGCGALAPIDSDAAQPMFVARCVVVARTASRLRRDFELDAQGLTLAMTLLERVQDLETQLSELRALLPHRVL
jgi:chaperone modulatory protein CbpM